MSPCPHRARVYLVGAAGAGWPVLRAALRSCRPPLAGAGRGVNNPGCILVQLVCGRRRRHLSQALALLSSGLGRKAFLSPGLRELPGGTAGEARRGPGCGCTSRTGLRHKNAVRSGVMQPHPSLQTGGGVQVSDTQPGRSQVAAPTLAWVVPLSQPSILFWVEAGYSGQRS